MRKQVQSILIGNGRIYFKFLIEYLQNEDDYNKNGLQLTINKLKAKSVIGVNMNTKTYYISKSLGAFRKIGINEGVIERAIKGKYDKYNMYWFYICDVDIDKLKDQGFIEVYKI